jgi:hypothetical protein
MNKMTPEELEKFIHRNLRSLPVRRAPVSLESRVLAALDRQAALPWYRQSWSNWPAVARAVFLAMATSVAGLVLVGLHFGFTGVYARAFAMEIGERLGVLVRIYHGFTWTTDHVANLLGSIPPFWLYGGAVTVAALYATLFGLGTAAYRTLYRND